MAVFDLDSYATVQERIAQLYSDFPDASIRTFLVKSDGPEVIFEARVCRTPADVAADAYTSGFAREIEGKSPVNRTSHLENCESSAVGRALANLGYATDARRPSRSEMIKVARTREEHDAMLEYIKARGATAPDDATITVAGEAHNLKDHIRQKWAAIKERPLAARDVVDAVEKATGTRFGNGGER